MAKQSNPAIKSMVGMQMGDCHGIPGHLDQLILPSLQNQQMSIKASKKDILLLNFCSDLSALAEQSFIV